MTISKLSLTPIEAGYSVQTPQGEVLSVKLDGGFSRSRKDIDGAAETVNATWVTDEDGYNYLFAFFRNRANRAADPFLIDLILESSPLTEYTAKYMPGTLALQGKDGDGFTIGAQLEVLPLAEDTAFDSSLVDVFEASGGEPVAYLDLFAPIIAAWPDA